MCPSRELARQTYDVINGYCASLRADGWPELRTMLCIGGVDVRQQTEVLRQVTRLAGSEFQLSRLTMLLPPATVKSGRC